MPAGNSLTKMATLWRTMKGSVLDSITSSQGIPPSSPARAMSAQDMALTAPITLRFTQGTSTSPATGSHTSPSLPRAIKRPSRRARHKHLCVDKMGPLSIDSGPIFWYACLNKRCTSAHSFFSSDITPFTIIPGTQPVMKSRSCSRRSKAEGSINSTRVSTQSSTFS